MNNIERGKNIASGFILVLMYATIGVLNATNTKACNDIFLAIRNAMAHKKETTNITDRRITQYWLNGDISDSYATSEGTNIVE